MNQEFVNNQKIKLKQFQVKINNILDIEERKIVEKYSVFQNSERLLEYICRIFVFNEQDIYEEVSEILFGYINFDHEFKIFSLEKNEVIKNVDKLFRLIDFMKSRLFSNFKNIYPLTFNINDNFSDFVDKNYKRFTDYPIQSFNFEFYKYCKQIIKNQLNNNFYQYKENIIFNSAIYNITQFFYMNSVFLEISYLDRLFEKYEEYKLKENIAGLQEIILKLNFIFRFCNQMISFDDLSAKYHQRSDYMSNFYTNYLTNNWEMYQKEYSNNFMYRTIDQIKIFSCFYFSRLQIVTADTGAGKSTQIPRMLVYYNLCFKIFDGELDNFTTKIACSQPTLKALNTLLSIKNNLEIEEEQNQRKQDVLYYQSIISRKQNMEQIPKQKCLCFYTDGKLLADILSFFIISQEDKVELKNKVKDLYDEKYLQEIVKNFIEEMAGVVSVIDKSIDKGTIKQREKITYKLLTWKPKYNWLIIDEAHKKNQNIELIISFMKFYFKRNNNVNLCIMSATIENDKMNYKRFFSEFSQFRLHMRGVKRLKPVLHIFDFKQSIKSHQMLIKSILLNKIKPMIDLDLQQNPNNLFHDILVFQHSKEMVRSLVEEINQYYEDERFLAIPIYSEVPAIISDLIEDKIETLKKFQCPKSQLLQFIYGEKTNKIKTNYKYLIIVGTPIIEESITVRYLRYVIDSGLEQKVLQIQQTEQIYVSFINRNSQIQRQGRICRIPGIPGDYFSLFSSEQIFDVQNLGLLNFNPLPVLFQIANIIKSYIEDFNAIFDVKKIIDIMYNQEMFYEFICSNLISKLQPFNLNQILQNYVIPYELCDKNYSNVNYIQIIFQRFLKNQVPVFDQLQTLFQPLQFQIQPNLLKRQYQLAIQKDKINKILIYLSYFLINNDFPPFFMREQEKEAKMKDKPTFSIQGNYLEQIQQFKKFYLEIEKQEKQILKFLKQNQSKFEQEFQSNIQIYISMKKGEEFDKFKDLIQFFSYLPAKREIMRLQESDDLQKWNQLFIEFCKQTIFGISQFYLVSFRENSIKQMYFKYQIQDSCLVFEDFGGYELNNFNYQLVFPQNFQKNRYLFVQFFKLNLTIDHQLKQMKPKFTFFNLIKSFDDLNEFKKIQI